MNSGKTEEKLGILQMGLKADKRFMRKKSAETYGRVDNISGAQGL